MGKNLIRLWAKLKDSQEGAVAVFVGAALIVLVGAIGIAVDIGRAQLVQSKLSSSLDAAGLAAASTVNTTDLNADVDKYLNVNFQSYLGSHITSSSVAVNDTNSVFTLAASATLPTTFMRIFGQDTMQVSAASEITRAVSGLELAIVLDNTGSMAGTKIDDLKIAAHQLVDILFGDGAGGDNLWVGLVPFSQSVNIGSSHAAWMDTAYTSSLNWGPTTWMGCVDARATGGDVTDAPPSEQLFKAYYWPDHNSYNNWIKSNGSYQTPLTTSRGPNKYCPEEVLPMTSDRAAIDTAIDAMAAVGYTHINLGAVWGWRMLSPRWRGLWGGDMDANSLPLDYNTVRMNKAAIIMTDGENTVSNSIHTAYWYPADGKLGTTSVSAAQAQLDTRLSQVCTAMKSNNIIVYTIAFGSPGSNVQNLLRNCATQPDYYFDSPTGTELQAAFKAIGDSLSNLRVSK